MANRLFHIVILLLVATIFFTAGVNYGQPDSHYSPATTDNGWLNGATIYHPDAFAYVSLPYSMLLRKIAPVKPNYYHNPSVAIYLNMIISWASGATSLYHNKIDPTTRPPQNAAQDCVSGQPPHPICIREVGPFTIYVVGRYISAFLSLLTVAIAYQMGRVLANEYAGLLSAVLVTCCPMVIQHAHYELPSAPTLFFSSAALLMGLQILKQKQPSWRIYLIAGLCIGLATASRYNAVVVALPILILMSVKWRQHGQIMPLLIGITAIPVGFLIGVPGAIFETKAFLRDVTGIFQWYNVTGGGAGWTTQSAIQSIVYYWRYMTLIVLGPVAVVASILGLIKLLRSYHTDRQYFWIGIGLLCYMVIYTVLALSSKRINANLLIPLILPITLLAAYAIALSRNYAVRFLTGSLVLLWPLYLSLNLITLFSTLDTRLQAQAWIFANIPQQTPIYLMSSYNVPIDPLAYAATQTYVTDYLAEDKMQEYPIIVYSDTTAFVTLRDRSLTENAVEIEHVENVVEYLKQHWIELKRFNRVYWPGQTFPPDDISYWHQMEIVIYCNPSNCPIEVQLFKNRPNHIAVR